MSTIQGYFATPALLDDLGAKLAARGLATDLFRADMRAFALKRRYANVFIGFNSFAHNLTQEDQLRTPRCCREHLADGGHLTRPAERLDA